MTKQELMQIIKFDDKDLIPVIVQDYHSKHIRMLAYMNKEALEKTFETGRTYIITHEAGINCGLKEKKVDIFSI